MNINNLTDIQIITLCKNYISNIEARNKSKLKYIDIPYIYRITYKLVTERLIDYNIKLPLNTLINNRLIICTTDSILFSSSNKEITDKIIDNLILNKDFILGEEEDV